MKTVALVLLLVVLAALAHVEAFDGQDVFEAPAITTESAAVRRNTLASLGPAIREKGMQGHKAQGRRRSKRGRFGSFGERLHCANRLRNLAAPEF